MVSVAEIKVSLPDCPDDVIEQWLHYFANEADCGWPPPQPLGTHRWRALLGGKPLSWWANVTWVKTSMNCELENLTQRTRTGVSEIVSQFNAGTADESTNRRVANAWLYLKNNGVFPRALVAVRKSDGVSLIDGSHRMAAFELLQRLSNSELEQLGVERLSLRQEIWLGTHAAGEVPEG